MISTDLNVNEYITSFKDVKALLDQKLENISVSEIVIVTNGKCKSDLIGKIASYIESHDVEVSYELKEKI